MARPPKYPWRDLEIGEWFAFPGTLKSAKAQAWAAGKRTGKKFKAEEICMGVIITRVEAPESHGEPISPEAPTYPAGE